MYPSIDNIFMWLFFFFAYFESLIASLMAQMIKHLPPMRETQVQPLGQEDPVEKGMGTHSVFLPGESRGQRSLAG